MKSGTITRRGAYLIFGALSFAVTLHAWASVSDRPLSKQYILFLERAEAAGYTPEEQDRQMHLQKIPMFDTSGAWKESLTYLKFISLFTTVGCIAVAFRKPRENAV